MKKSLETFSDRLNYAMQKKNITAYTLAKLSGVSMSLISHYMNHGTIPRRDKLVSIANCLDVSCDWLLYNDKNFARNILNKKSISIPVYIKLSPSKNFFNADDNIHNITVDTTNLERGKNYFALYASDEHMSESGINSQDILIFEKNPVLEGDMIGCFHLNGNILCRKIVIQDDVLILQANHDISSTVIKDNDIFDCVGKLIMIIRNVR